MAGVDGDRIEVFIDVFDEKQQRALVLEKLSVEKLMLEIAHEFDGIETDEIERYVLIDKETRRDLKPELSLIEQNIQHGDMLDFVYRPKGIDVAPVKKRVPAQSTAVLVLQRSESESEGEAETRFEIGFQPAIIGRHDPIFDADTLAVDLAGVPNARMLSRQHAQLTEANGVWSIKRIKETNKLYVDGEIVPFGETQKLAEGSVIELGPKVVKLIFENG